MKKVTVLIAMLSLFAFSAKAQLFDFTNNLTDATIGFNIGAVGYDFANGHIDKTYNGFGGGMSISILGVYLDFIYQSPEHKWGNKISPEVYHDHTALTINAGYKIPVTSWLNLTPLIGFSNETEGWTDCSTINVDEDHSIYHDYDTEEIYPHFNYGVGLSVKPFKWIEIGGVCTSHAVYGNISFNLYEIQK